VESNLALLHSMSSQLLLLLAFINFHSVTILTVSSSATDRPPMSVRQKGGAISSARPPAAYERSEGKIKASPPPNPYSAPRSPWRLPPPARAVDPVSGDAWFPAPPHRPPPTTTRGGGAPVSGNALVFLWMPTWPYAASRPWEELGARQQSVTNCLCE
jgi:hypothetical protein